MNAIKYNGVGSLDKPTARVVGLFQRLSTPYLLSLTTNKNWFSPALQRILVASQISLCALRAIERP